MDAYTYPDQRHRLNGSYPKLAASVVDWCATKVEKLLATASRRLNDEQDRREARAEKGKEDGRCVLVVPLAFELSGRSLFFFTARHLSCCGGLVVHAEQ